MNLGFIVMENNTAKLFDMRDLKKIDDVVFPCGSDSIEEQPEKRKDEKK